jgi:hypothetical protein
MDPDPTQNPIIFKVSEMGISYLKFKQCKGGGVG